MGDAHFSEQRVESAAMEHGQRCLILPGWYGYYCADCGTCKSARNARGIGIKCASCDRLF